MPVCGSCSPGKPPGLTRPQGSWGCAGAPPSCPPPAQALLFQHSHGSVPAPSESPCPPTGTGLAPKPGGSTVVLALLGSGAAGTPGHRAGTECACCTCHRVPLKHPWTCLTLREVQQNLQMSSAREQCYEGLYSLFFEVLVMVCLVRLLVCPGFPSPPFFSGGPCKYVQRPCSPSISSAFSCADLYNDLFKGTWIK